LTEWGFRSHAGEVFISKSDLQPAPEDLRICHGDNDPECMGAAEADSVSWAWLDWAVGRAKAKKDELAHVLEKEDEVRETAMVGGFPTRFKLWQLLFAHRDYFWRLGLCLPGGDPVDWGRDNYNVTRDNSDEIRDL